MMSKKYKRTNTTITLSLNFNNEYEYGFTVDIDPREFTWKQVRGTNRKELLPRKI